MDSEGKNFQRLTRSPSNEESPCWSSDGRYLAFSAKRGGKSDIYIINADGLNERRLTFSGGDNYSPSWSPHLIK
jgi:TolB protein